MTPRFKILYVDDEPALLNLAKIFLSRLGPFEISVSTSVSEALQKYPITTFDAIIADYEMPETNGIEFLKLIRKENGDTPFILFTGKGREEVVIQAINNGADSYIQKGGDPVAQFAELAHKINQAVGRKKTADQLYLLKTSVDQAYDEVFWVDFAGNIMYANEAACKTTGYSYEELVSMPLFQLSPYLTEHFWNIFKADLRLAKKRISITKHKRKDGTLIDVEVLSSYVRQGDREYSFAFVRNLTAEPRNETGPEQNSEYLKNLFSSRQYGMAFINIYTHEIMDINPTGAQILGYNREEMIGKPCHAFLCPVGNRSCPITEIPALVHTTNCVLLSKSGKEIPCTKTVSRIASSLGNYILETFVDISESPEKTPAAPE